MRGSLLCLLLIGSLTAARAEKESLTWDSWMGEGKVVIAYGVPETDDVRFSIACKVSDGMGVLHPGGGDIVGVKKGERVNFTVSGPGGTRSYTAVAQYQDELDGPSTFVSVDLVSARDALAPLSKPGTLTIRFPKNSTTMPLGPKAAQALNTFRSRCPPAKQSSK